EKELEVEEVTLIEFDDEHGVLVLTDGRRLLVSPEGFTTAILWRPTSTLEVSEEEDEGVFDQSVTLKGTDQTILARWELGGASMKKAMVSAALSDPLTCGQE